MAGVTLLQPYQNLFMKQSRKGCLRTLLGCDAATEFDIATIENHRHNVFYAKEESGCFCRTCCQAIHPFRMHMYQGSTHSTNAPLVAIYERPLRCHTATGKCCCYQQIDVFDGQGMMFIGQVRETFFCCIPTYHVFDKNQHHTHTIHPPTCCCGCCVNVCAESQSQGCCCGCFTGSCCRCRVPIYIYDADGYNGKDHSGKIVRVWGSLVTEMIGVHKFEVVYPPDASNEQKAIFNGATFLMNELYFKAHSESDKAGAAK